MMLIVFIGIQIPLITLVFAIVLFVTPCAAENLSRLFLLLFANAIAIALSQYALYAFLSPNFVPSDIVSQYLSDYSDKDLAADTDQEVGTLIADTGETLKRLDEVIQRLTKYDTVTGLPNQDFFQSYIQQAIHATGIEEQFALIVLDLDSLKDINSSLGRKIGDLLLINVAQRLTKLLAPDDILARFCGDEFIVLRQNITEHDSLITLSHDLLNSFLQPFVLDGQEVFCTAKVGITIYPLDGLTVDQLLQSADTTLCQAKQKKLNTYQFYSRALRDELKRTLAIKEKLHYALSKQEFCLEYQPRISITTGQIVGVEALLRWNNPELGLVSPAEFVPLAETTNLIIPIGEWVLRHACLQNKQWQESGLPPLRVSVNLSPCQFKQVNLIETVDRILQDTDLDQTYLELEITESLLVEDIDKAIALLQELKCRGVSIALDDFGTGYSSLSYLQKLPIDTLKIDRSFVTNIASNPDDAAISKAIVALAHSLELKITAEGVETEEQLNYLQNQGCHEVQGYYISKPLSPQLFPDFLATYQANNGKYS